MYSGDTLWHNTVHLQVQLWTCMSIGMCWYIVVLFCVVIWCAAELRCNIALPFIIRFVIFINDDNEGLNVINLMNINILNVVFINWQHFFFPIKAEVNKAINSYWKQRFWTTKYQNFVSQLRPETQSGSHWLEYKDTCVSTGNSSYTLSLTEHNHKRLSRVKLNINTCG